MLLKNSTKFKKEEPEEPAPPVEKEPSFPILLEDMTVGEGKDIVLKCKVSGNPRPTVSIDCCVPLIGVLDLEFKNLE